MVGQHYYCSYQSRKTKFTWPSSNCSLTHSVSDEALKNLNNMLRIKRLHNQIFKNSFNTLLDFIVHLSVLYRMLLEQEKANIHTNIHAAFVFLCTSRFSAKEKEDVL